jgi:sugar-phosphatase
MRQIHCAGLLFDMDGVLVDSTPAVARVWSWWAKQRGFDPEETVRRAHGRPSITTIRELLPEGDHEADNQEVERREIEDVEGVVALPGAVEILRALPADRWTVVTSATRALAEVRLLAGGLPVPRKMVTWDDVKHGKPNPEPYLKGAEFLGVPPAECVVAEDAPAGIRSGKAAGARVIALRTTAEDAELMAAGANWIVDDLSKITVEPAKNGAMLRLALADTK